MFKKVILLPFLMLLAYIVSSIVSSGMSDIISPLYFFSLSLIVLKNANHIKQFRVNWILLFATILSWGMVDLLWFYLSIFTNYIPDDMTLFTYLYLIPDTLVMATAVLYFVQNSGKWGKLQLLIDSVAVTLITLISGYAIFFSDSLVATIDNLDALGTILYLISDFIIVVTIVTMVSSSGYNKIRATMKYILLAYFLYVTADLIYIDSYFRDVYMANSISDIMFMLSFLIFTYASYHAVKEPDTYAKSLAEGPLNVGKSKMIWWTALFPSLLFIFKRLQLLDLTLILGVVVLYLIVSHYVQKLVLVERLFEAEHDMKIRLEKEVTAQTRELLISKEALERKAITDSLTHLYNRDYFIECLDERIKIDQPFTVAYLDLDRFKIINDLYGHPMGDQVLIVIGKRFSNQMDITFDIFRVGGDEFAVIIPSIDTHLLTETSQLIQAITSEAVVVDQFTFNIDASVGYSRYPLDAKSASDLVKSADIAMYHAKSDVTSVNHVFYSSQLIEGLERRNHVELLLRSADFSQDFELYYQPQFNAHTLELVGIEALIRWQHKEEGFISPNEFIPIAEEIGLITKVHDFVFDEAIQQMMKWNKTYDKRVRMSINLSPLVINCIDFYDKIEDYFKTHDVDPSLIEFEITEHSAMNTSVMMTQVFDHLKRLGIAISIDDFGTGYSSLSYLKRFNVDTLKIAKELIFNVEEGEDERLIVKAIIMMASGLGLHTIAEGIETSEQLEILKSLGCEIIQGYYLGRPLDVKTFELKNLKK